MITILTIFHVIVCIFLILVVLLQQGKGADWAGAFGGGGTQTAFGARGAGTVLSKATTAAAIIFMITSLALTILISRPGGSSVIREGAKQRQQQQQRRRKRNSNVCSTSPKWWNWQTHHLEGVAPRGVRVRIPPSA
jgi:preprotein translocase subunit SecG